MIKQNKVYFANIYAPSTTGRGALIKTIKDFEWDGYDWNINAGQGESQIRFPRSIENFSENVEIALFNQFDIYVLDKESASTGTLVYSGELIEYSSEIAGADEYISGTLWGFATDTAVSILEDGSGNTTISYNSMDPSDILQDVMDKYNGRITSNLPPFVHEEFTNTTYKDPASNGYWNTVGGVLNLQNGTFSFDNTGESDWPFGQYAGTEKTSQCTTLHHPMTITTWRVKIKKVGNPLDNVTAKIYGQNANGSPNYGDLKASSSTTIAGTALGTSYAYKDFTFAYAGARDQQIAISLERSGAADASNYYVLEYHYDADLVHFSLAMFYVAFLERGAPMALTYQVTYTTTDDNAQSLAYDMDIANPTYLEFGDFKALTAGASIAYLFSESDDNISWGAWVSDFTSLSKRYFRWKATVTGGQANVSYMTFDVVGGSIHRTYTEVSCDFKQNTIQECIDQCKTMAPAWWYYRIGADNQLIFDVRNTDIVNHTLTIGKDVIKGKFTRSAKELRNLYYFLGGGDPQMYVKKERAVSSGLYGKRANRSQDERILYQDSASIIIDTYLDTYDHPAVMGSVTIADSNGDDGGYDIESFKPGQVVVIEDPKSLAPDSKWDEFYWDEGYWDFPLSSATGVPFQIISISYTLDKATLELAYFAQDGAKRINDIKRNLEQSRTKNSPIAPTLII